VLIAALSYLSVLYARRMRRRRAQHS